MDVFSFWPSLGLLTFFLVIFLECRAIGGRVTLPLGRFPMFFAYGCIGAPLLAFLLQQIPFLQFDAIENARGQLISPAAWLSGPPIEELAKALPIIVLAFVLGVSRRLSIADLTLAGFAIGAGFGFVESNLDALVSGMPPSFEHAFGFGFESVQPSAGGYAVYFAGHAVYPALFGLAAGAGLRFLPPRWFYVGIPAAVVFLLASFDHGMFNWKLLHPAAADSDAFLTASTPTEILYLLLLHGRLEIWLLPIGLIAAQAVESWFCAEATGKRPDLLLPREAKPWVLNEWLVALLRLPLGRATVVRTLAYFRLRRAFAIASLETKRHKADRALARHVLLLEQRLKRERQLLYDPPHGHWLLSRAILKHSFKSWAWRTRWVSGFAVLFVLLFMLGADQLPQFLRGFLFGDIFTAAIIALGLGFAGWRSFVFVRQPRPDRAVAEGAEDAVYWMRGLLLGASLLCGMVPGLSLLLGWKALVPGAAFIGGYLPGWIGQGGNLHTLMGLGAIGGAVEPDATPVGQALRNEIAAGSERIRELKRNVEAGTVPARNLDAFLEAMLQLDAERDAQARRRLALEESEREAASARAKDLGVAVDAAMREFGRLQGELDDAAAHELERIAAFEHAYALTWSQLMRDLDAYDALSENVSALLRQIWPQQRDLAWALRIAQSMEETLLPLQILLLPELETFVGQAEGDSAIALDAGLERIRAASVGRNVAVSATVLEPAVAVEEDTAPLHSVQEPATPTETVASQPADVAESADPFAAVHGETWEEAPPRTEPTQEDVARLLATIKRDSGYLKFRARPDDADAADAAAEPAEPREQAQPSVEQRHDPEQARDAAPEPEVQPAIATEASTSDDAAIAETTPADAEATQASALEETLRAAAFLVEDTEFVAAPRALPRANLKAERETAIEQAVAPVQEQRPETASEQPEEAAPESMPQLPDDYETGITAAEPALATTGEDTVEPAKADSEPNTDPSYVERVVAVEDKEQPAPQEDAEDKAALPPESVTEAEAPAAQPLGDAAAPDGGDVSVPPAVDAEANAPAPVSPDTQHTESASASAAQTEATDAIAAERHEQVHNSGALAVDETAEAPDATSEEPDQELSAIGVDADSTPADHAAAAEPEATLAPQQPTEGPSAERDRDGDEEDVEELRDSIKRATGYFGAPSEPAVSPIDAVRSEDEQAELARLRDAIKFHSGYLSATNRTETPAAADAVPSRFPQAIQTHTPHRPSEPPTAEMSDVTAIARKFAGGERQENKVQEPVQAPLDRLVQTVSSLFRSSRRTPADTKPIETTAPPPSETTRKPIASEIVQSHPYTDEASGVPAVSTAENAAVAEPIDDKAAIAEPVEAAAAPGHAEPAPAHSETVPSEVVADATLAPPAEERDEPAPEQSPVAEAIIEPAAPTQEAAPEMPTQPADVVEQLTVEPKAVAETIVDEAVLETPAQPEQPAVELPAVAEVVAEASSPAEEAAPETPAQAAVVVEQPLPKQNAVAETVVDVPAPAQQPAVATPTAMEQPAAQVEVPAPTPEPAPDFPAQTAPAKSEPSELRDSEEKPADANPTATEAPATEAPSAVDSAATQSKTEMRKVWPPSLQDFLRTQEDTPSDSPRIVPDAPKTEQHVGKPPPQEAAGSPVAAPPVARQERKPKRGRAGKPVVAASKSPEPDRAPPIPAQPEAPLTPKPGPTTIPADEQAQLERLREAIKRKLDKGAGKDAKPPSAAAAPQQVHDSATKAQDHKDAGRKLLLQKKAAKPEPADEQHRHERLARLRDALKSKLENIEPIADPVKVEPAPAAKTEKPTLSQKPTPKADGKDANGPQERVDLLRDMIKRKSDETKTPAVVQLQQILVAEVEKPKDQHPRPPETSKATDSNEKKPEVHAGPPAPELRPPNLGRAKLGKLRREEEQSKRTAAPPSGIDRRKAPAPEPAPVVSQGALADALADYYGKLGQPQPSMYTTDKATLLRVIESGRLEMRRRGDSPWSVSGLLRKGEVALRLKPGAERFVELVPSRELFGLVPQYYPRGVGRGTCVNYVMAEHLECFDAINREWLPLKVPAAGKTHERQK